MFRYLKIFSEAEDKVYLIAKAPTFPEAIQIAETFFIRFKTICPRHKYILYQSYPIGDSKTLFFFKYRKVK